jgi:(p)ppGpp synthase/HD superfamily hydrolase
MEFFLGMQVLIFFSVWIRAQVIDTIIAGVLHDVIDDTDRDHQSVRMHFGDDVSKLVAGVSRLSNINQVAFYLLSNNRVM